MHMSIGASGSQRLWVPRARVTGGYKLPDPGAGNQMWALCNSSICSVLWS